MRGERDCDPERIVKPSSPHRALWIALAAALGCGAKTGLNVPDVAAIGDASDDTFERFDACVEGRFRLVRREARMVFVVDRSGSMSQPLVMGEPRDRWSTLYEALGQTLPRFEASMELGALIFPRVPASGALASAQACDQLPGDGLDVSPARNNATTLLRAVALFPPGGATPTAAAIGRATRYIAAHEVRGLAQYIVLATDGGPNCNATLNPVTCVCPVMSGCGAAGLGARYCLDDVATVASIDAARRRGIGTFVIGIDGDLGPDYVDVLDRMALAGGRALAATRRYYSVREGNQLGAAFEEIQRTVVRCAYVTPSRPDDPERIVVRAGDAVIRRDTTRRDGWDWTDRDYGELTLFGTACERALMNSQAPDATVRCGG
jgi:von Willebrand factor type A domain